MGREAELALTWIAVLLIATLVIYSLWRALFWDRSHGQRRCPKCWHTVLEFFPYRCSECGYFTLFEGNLFRTRRRLGWAVVSMLALTAGTIWLRDQLSTRSWWSLFPDRMVIALLPISDAWESTRDIPPHLSSCLTRGEISQDNRMRLLSRCVQGDSWATPGSIAWMQKYASIVEKIDQFPPGAAATEQTREDMDLGLNAVAPVISLDLPTQWNAAEPLFATANVRDWWPAQSEVLLRVSEIGGIPVSPEAGRRHAQEAWQRVGATNSRNTSLTINLGALPVGNHAGEMLVTWETTLPHANPGAFPPHSSGVVAIPIKIEVLANRQTLIPLSNAELDTLVREAFEPGLIRWPDGLARHAFSYQPYRTSSSDLDPVAFGMVVEALEGGVPRRRLNVWWRGGRGGSRAGFEIGLEDPSALDQAEKSGKWTLRIRGDETLARRVAGLYPHAPVTHWWSGDVEIPLNVSDRPGERSSGRSERGRAWVLREANDASKAKLD